MANRTVQVWGQGYGATPCTITAFVSGNQVFSGEIPTVNSPDILRIPTEQQIIFSFDIPLVTANTANVFQNYTLPMTLEITGSDIYMEQILANYSQENDPPTPGPDIYGAINFIGDARSNVTCSNASYVSPAPPPGVLGTWGWEVEVAAGQTATFSYDLVVSTPVVPPT